MAAEVIEIEKRWLLIDPIDMSKLDGWNRLDITQVYLENFNKESERIRMIKDLNGVSSYSHTIKKPAKVGQFENEEVISESRFMELMNRANLKHQTILKTRYVKEIGDFKFEVDQFIHPISFRVLEVEIESMDIEIEIPDVLGRYIEVTGDKSLSNHSLSLRPKNAKKNAATYVTAYLEKDKKKKKRN